MPLNLDAFPAALRAKQIALGRQYSSNDTLEQAKQTLNALDSHGALLLAEGFAASDRQRLVEARDLLIAAGVGRQSVRSEHKTASLTLVDALDAAKVARLRARTILENTQAALYERSDPEAAQGVREIETVLARTSTVADEAERLATQLDLLAGVLGQKAVSEAAAERGGPSSLTELGEGARALREADQRGATPPGTPAETQRLDQIDGIIIDLVRRARKAAVSASRRTGNPALLKAFELNALYRSRRRSASREEDETDPDEGGAG